MAKAKKQAVVEEIAQPVKKAAPRVRAAKHRTPAAAVNSPEESQPVLQETTHAEVAAKAYSYWESRGYQGGDALDDWFRAEDELGRKALSATA
jgi:putative hemolysin